MMNKTCTKCNETKPLDCFYLNKRYKDGYHNHCKECKKAYGRNRWANDPAYAERKRQQAKANRRGEKIKPVGTARPATERFNDKWIEDENGCHVWIAGTNKDGYGKISDKSKTYYAHRFSYIQKHGSIPENHELHHICENKLCVNPLHLQPMTSEEHSALHNEN